MTLRWMVSGLLFLFSASFAFAAGGRHALIIGIGKYADASETAPLLGVPKDIENARRIAGEMGVPDHAITVLRDHQATKANILHALQQLNQRVEAGDRVFIYHSGHGTRYPKNGMCLQGLQTYTEGRFTVNDILTDDELARYTRPISERADKVLAMLDTCFSGGVLTSTTRSLDSALSLRPKFHAGADVCDNVGVNQPKTRSLLSEMQRLGVHEENFVQIAAADHNEVSWDTAELGGLATHALTQCLLGDASDLNQSGAVSLDEVRVCAQTKLNTMMKPHAKAGLLPSTIQVRGNRNLIPVVTQPAQVITPTALKPVVEAVPAVENPPPSTAPADPTVQTDAQAVPVATVPPPTFAESTLATLQDVVSQRNPKHRLKVTVAKPKLKIGRDELGLNIESSRDGYVYLVLLGSDAKSFYVLFPNGLDSGNRIRSGKPMQLPGPLWRIKAAGPPGVDHVLVMVTDSPRSLEGLTLQVPTESEPFTYALSDISGRRALIDYLTGVGVKGRSESFGAQLIKIEEVQ